MVNEDVIDLFEDASKELIAMHGGDANKALKMAMAYMSGCYKGAMANRSLLSGQEKFITYQIEMNQTFHGVGLVWNILRRFAPENIVSGIMGMRAVADMNGGVFDVPEEVEQQFKDIFQHAKDQGQRMDFEVSKCIAMPELLEKDAGRGAH